MNHKGKRSSVGDSLAQYASMLSSFNDAKHIITGDDNEVPSSNHNKKEKKRDKIIPWGSSSNSAPKIPPKVPPRSSFTSDDEIIIPPFGITGTIDQEKKKRISTPMGSLETARQSVWDEIGDDDPHRDSYQSHVSKIKQADTDAGGGGKHRNLAALRYSGAFVSLGLLAPPLDDLNDDETGPLKTKNKNFDKSISCWKRHMWCIIVNFVAVAIMSTFIVFTFVLPEGGSTVANTKTIQSLPNSIADDASSSVAADPQISLHDTVRAEKESLSLIIHSRMPSIVFENRASPQSKALHWMLHDGYRSSSSFQLEDDKMLDKLLQRFALVTFWYSTNGEIWDSTRSWLQPNFNECYWKWQQPPQQQKKKPEYEYEFFYYHPKNEIVCDNSKDSILQLIADFNSHLLSGTIPAEIGLLQSITVLNLSGNTLSGTIPSEIGNHLTNLVSLNLSNNRLGGTIPKEMLGQMTDLKELILNGNNLTGSIPTELALLTKLSKLDLRDNALGPIPAEIIGKLTNLPI